ncbi:MAG: hypothetical protein GWP91_17765, partial [Rhodobacterales bacterium]|nr:hypothetical protein [Rhodobacterales bacterium]
GGAGWADIHPTDTIAAWEGYLEENPEGRWVMEANSRLESLYLEKAKEEKSLEAYDVYLERFPEGHLREQGLDERESFLFNWANSTNTMESWTQFLEEYPKADKRRKSAAKSMINVHKYLPNLEVGAPMMKQINLAEDPEGPLDGWEFSCEVTNNGEATIESIHLTIQYLSTGGGIVGSKEWPVVAPFWRIPIEEEYKQPIKPGETRIWKWTTGNMPDSWSRQNRIYASRIKLLGKK